MSYFNSPHPIAVRRAVAADMIGVGVCNIDYLISTGQIEAKKAGRNLLIVVESLDRYIAGLPPAELNSYAGFKKPAKLTKPTKPTAPKTAAAAKVG